MIYPRPYRLRVNGKNSDQPFQVVGVCVIPRGGQHEQVIAAYKSVTHAAIRAQQLNLFARSRRLRERRRVPRSVGPNRLPLVTFKMLSNQQ